MQVHLGIMADDETKFYTQNADTLVNKYYGTVEVNLLVLQKST